MSRRRRKTNFEESIEWNMRSYQHYLTRLTELAISMFDWENLPLTMNSRYLEISLFNSGNAIAFRDEDLGGDMLNLDCTVYGGFNVYGDPVKRRAYSKYNNYQKILDETDSVIIWNNYMRTNSVYDIELYARRLAKLDRVVDVNSNAQKTPILIKANEKQRLSMLQVYKQYEGNEPVIFGDDSLTLDGVTVLQTNAPYVSDKIYELKVKYWNEALTYLGISNLSVNKKERLITDEVQRNQGGTIASRNSRLKMRQKACEDINTMFGTNISVTYHEFDNNELTLDGETGGEFDE